jgi:hypothetical protein
MKYAEVIDEVLSPLIRSRSFAAVAIHRRARDAPHGPDPGRPERFKTLMGDPILILFSTCCAWSCLLIGRTRSLASRRPIGFRVAPPLPPAEGRGDSGNERSTNCFARPTRSNRAARFVIADGHYFMPRFFDIPYRQRHAARGIGPSRSAWSSMEFAACTANSSASPGCEGATIADLTIQNIKWNGFKINSDKYTTEVTIHNCIIHNIWQRGVKGPKVRARKTVDRFRPERLQNSILPVLQRSSKTPRRMIADDARHGFGDNYIGGIDVMFARRWIDQRQRVHRHQRQDRRSPRSDLPLAGDRRLHRSSETSSSIATPASAWAIRIKPADIAVHCTGCIVRNNFVTRCPEQFWPIIRADCPHSSTNTIHEPPIADAATHPAGA